MKKSILYFCMITSILFQFNCSRESESNDIELIKDYYKDYMIAENADIRPVPVNVKTDEAMLKQEQGIKDLFKSEGIGLHNYLYELYLNEEGSIDKIKIINGMGDDLDKKIILSQADNWKYKPAQKDGKNVKCRFRIVWSINFRPGGDFSVSQNTLMENTSVEINRSGSEDFSKIKPDPEYLVMADEMPEPIGGTKAIQDKIHYPEIAKRAGIEGKVYLLTFINEQGTVDKISVIRGVAEMLDSAAVYAVKDSKFTPGRQSGKAVKTQVTVPVVFKLN